MIFFLIPLSEKDWNELASMGWKWWLAIIAGVIAAPCLFLLALDTYDHYQEKWDRQEQEAREDAREKDRQERREARRAQQ